MSEKTYKPVLISSITAKTDIKKCRFIGFDGNYCTAGVKAYGVSDVETDKEEMLPVSVIGVLLIEAGGAVTVGAKVTSDAEGRAVAITDSEECNGYALDEATATGEFIRIIRGI